MDKFTIAANIAFFVLEKTGSVCGTWRGRLKAAEQRSLFGTFLGKGVLEINGATEKVAHDVKVCFGLDSETTFSGGLAKLYERGMALQRNSTHASHTAHPGAI